MYTLLAVGVSEYMGFVPTGDAFEGSYGMEWDGTERSVISSYQEKLLI